MRETRKGRFDRGDALEWSRVDFGTRREFMVNSLVDGLRRRTGSISNGTNETIIVPFEGKEILFKCHAIPAKMTISAAREMVGRPFLDDHKVMTHLSDDRIGPVHVIACHRNITEKQAMSTLGIDDALVVTPPFGEL